LSRSFVRLRVHGDRLSSRPLARAAVPPVCRAEAIFLAAGYANLALFHSTAAGLSDPHRRELLGDMRQPLGAARLNENDAAKHLGIRQRMATDPGLDSLARRPAAAAGQSDSFAKRSHFAWRPASLLDQQHDAGLLVVSFNCHCAWRRQSSGVGARRAAQDAASGWDGRRSKPRRRAARVALVRGALRERLSRRSHFSLGCWARERWRRRRTPPPFRLLLQWRLQRPTRPTATSEIDDLNLLLARGHCE